MQNKKKSLVEQSFPFEHLSVIAERESWRKEVNRPTSYIHKWWARRLGSVFRGLIIGGAEDSSASFSDQFYQNSQYNNLTIFDPFMGSGTTITEAVKLGAKVVGSDINPVAVTMVRTALEKYDRHEVISSYKKIEKNCAEQIKNYYKAWHDGALVDVLYYFWVKTVTCDDCGTDIPLYKTTVFSKNAYASKKPAAQSICPHCSAINQIKYSDENTTCKNCGKSYNPQKGNISGIEYICPICGKHERIIEYARRKGEIIPSRLYAKMIVDSHGNKKYLSIDEYDIALYEKAQDAVSDQLECIPSEAIHPGTNTDQILGYNYRQWRDMFNARQLLSFSILMQEIRKIDDIPLRRLFSVLMSGTLEFNNMFCSFKGEGTGAVRPLFYNHILKSELMPLEANVWGCTCSSGAFSALFKTRVLRLLDYKEHPFELAQTEDGSFIKKMLDQCSIETTPTTLFDQWDTTHPLIICRNSACTGMPDKAIDLVVTDPPFFDNVNYSELADFFYVWLKKMDIGIEQNGIDTTRIATEVQDNNPDRFASKLSDVLRESCRVLKDDGMLIFTYHHSRAEGWASVYNAIRNAGFCISEVFPIKAEMSVSVAIQSAKVPINYDLVFVCRKNITADSYNSNFDLSEFNATIERIESCGLSFTEGDKAILLYGHILKHLSICGTSEIQKTDIETIFKSAMNNI